MRYRILMDWANKPMDGGRLSVHISKGSIVSVTSIKTYQGEYTEGHFDAVVWITPDPPTNERYSKIWIPLEVFKFIAEPILFAPDTLDQGGQLFSSVLKIKGLGEY
jgi:hypothetical protein